MTIKIRREFYGNRHKQKLYTSEEIAWQTAVFEAYGGRVEQVKTGVSGAKINPNRNLLHAKIGKAT